MGPWRPPLFSQRPCHVAEKKSPKNKKVGEIIFSKKIFQIFFDIFNIFVKNEIFEIFWNFWKKIEKKSNCPKIFVDPTNS